MQREINPIHSSDEVFQAKRKLHGKNVTQYSLRLEKKRTCIRLNSRIKPYFSRRHRNSSCREKNVHESIPIMRPVVRAVDADAQAGPIFGWR